MKSLYKKPISEAPKDSGPILVLDLKPSIAYGPDIFLAEWNPDSNQWVALDDQEQDCNDIDPQFFLSQEEL